MTSIMPTLQSIRTAQRRTSRLVTRSPVRESRKLGRRIDGCVRLKLETVQPTGSFKIRGAASALLAERERGTLRGVVTASTGNHGRAVAYVARQLGIDAVVCLADSVEDERVDAIAAEGAAIVRSATDQTNAIELAHSLADEHRYLFLPPFDHPDVISGQGTIGLELLQQNSRPDAVIVPTSGGGLLAGVALAIKELAPNITVIGVSAERAPAMRRALDAGRPVPVPEIDTVARSLMGDLGPDNRYTYPLVQRRADDVILLSEHDIDAAMRWALVHERLLVEGAAAVPIAYLLTEPPALHNLRTDLVITGDNITASSLAAAAAAL